MKKLMIVAAALAVAGIAEAVQGDDQMYQATFNLKTTVGKSGTATINLGKNAAGAFYYEDGELATWLDNTKAPNEMIKDTDEAKKFFSYKTVKGSTVPAPTADGLANAGLKNKLLALANTYNQKSAGVYCFTFKDELCYRVAGTIKVSGWFVDTECLINVAAGGIVDAFGAATLEKSNKVEVYSPDVSAFIPVMGKTASFNDFVDVLDNLKANRTITALAVAGHGTYGKVWDDVEGKASLPGVTAVSGYAVGTATQGKCVSCCAPATEVTAFNCCNYGADVDTVVFGTFTVKYNLSQTKKELY